MRGMILHFDNSVHREAQMPAFTYPTAGPADASSPPCTRCTPAPAKITFAVIGCGATRRQTPQSVSG